MRLFRIFAAAAGLLAAFLPASAPAQVESTPIPAPHKPNFSSMSFMLGTWTCKTKSSRRPAAFTTVSTYSTDSTGYWINGTSTTPPTSWVPVKLTTLDRYTYDSDTKRWVDVTWGDGGTYGLSFANGWTGNRIVWHDVSFAPTAEISSQSDTTVTKVSSTKMTTSSWFTEGKTGRKVTVAGVCTKQ